MPTNFIILMMTVTASIVLYNNNYEIVKKAVKSFLNNKLNTLLYLVDNSPNDSLKSLVNLNERAIIYIPSHSNPGFGAAHNIAIKEAFKINSKYHVILNPDIYFDNGELEKMVNFMDENSNIGQLMPKILYPNGSIQYLCKTNPTPFLLFARRFLPKFFQQIFKEKMDKYEYKDRDYNQIIYNVPYFSGCFMFFRISTLKHIGLFDEKIFMYIEDADITRRMLFYAKTVYYPNAQVYHHYEKGSYKNFKLMLYNIHGAIIYFNKWGWLINKEKKVKKCSIN